MVWTPEKVEQLKVHWNSGMSITQIGKSLGMTRNAVVGKAHRLGLDRRESPIQRSPEAPTAARPQAKSGPRCKWPIGDPKSQSFGFCDEPALEGRPYCAVHCAAAYTTWEQEQQQKSEKAA